MFALHLDTTSGTLYSADYPYYLAESLGKEFGDKFVSLFGNGTCGDINHIDVTAAAQKSARDIGPALAETVKGGLAQLPPIERPSLAVAREIVNAPIQKYTRRRDRLGKGRHGQGGVRRRAVSGARQGDEDRGPAIAQGRHPAAGSAGHPA